MAFRIRKSIRTAGDRTGEVFELTDEAETVRAEIWPQWGFNCLRWQVRDRSGRLGSVFYSAPDWASNPVPTRSGHPILFPFPGRLREGTFTFEGRRFVLPLNESTGKHAIHGFTPRGRWRVADAVSDAHCASVTGEFSLTQDFPDALPYWPADFRLAVTYSLYHDRLRVDAFVENLGPRSLPFGLGYHPYFQLPGVSDPNLGRYMLRVSAGELWESVDLLPTGARLPIPSSVDFRIPRPIADAHLDHVFAAARTETDSLRDMNDLAELSHPDCDGRVRILANPAFRELVLFTPPHRQAVAIEPYTCSANAANLAARGIDSGWAIIRPRTEWKAAVEYWWVSDC